MDDLFHTRSPFYRIFANTDRVKLLDIFLTNDQIPVDMSFLLKATGLHQKTIEHQLDVLMTADLVEQSEDGDLYRLANTDVAQTLEAYYTNTHNETLRDVIEATDDEKLD